MDAQRTNRPALAAIAAGVVALSTAAAFGGGPPNDDCSSPSPLSGTGTFPFDNVGATTGPEGQSCSEGGPAGIDNDIWFCWTATCSGIVTIDTCGSQRVDTKIALYDGCECPQDDTTVLCCNDNACAEQSQIICDVVCGKEYLIQVGNAPGRQPGAGMLRITCEGEPCDEPCCIDFNDGTTNGFGPCTTHPNIDVTVATPGPSGDADDFYLRLEDESGASLACGDACTGDWTEIAASGCGSLCFDIRIFEDGCVGGIPDCVANGGWIPLSPRIVISNGSVSAVFIANEQITDDEGPNPGWHSYCAPIAPLDSSGNLPNNDDGHWVMSGGAPNSDWNTLISNVTEVRLPIDFTANPAEVAGYDNICLREDACPCMEIVDEDIECVVDADGTVGGTYNLTFSVTNHSGVDAHYVLIPGDDVTPNVLPINPPLPGDGSQSATFTVQITNATPGEPYCLDVVLADENIEECCASELCVDLPECDCMILNEVAVECDAAGNAVVNFTLTNLTPDVIEHMFFVPQTAGVTVSPDYINVASLAPFTSQPFGPFTVTGAVPGEVLCIRISMHNESLLECCSEDLCFTVPDCAAPPPDPCDLNLNGVVGTDDLLILLSNWGPCAGSPCVGDLDTDNQVGVSDLLALFSTWGGN